MKHVVDVKELEKVLRDRLGELAIALLGEPVMRRGNQLRFHETLYFQGKPETNIVIVWIDGHRRGTWYGSIYAEGEDALDFIGHYAGTRTRADAIEYARLWLAGKLVPVPTYAPANLVGNEV